MQATSIILELKVSTFIAYVLTLDTAASTENPELIAVADLAVKVACSVQASVYFEVDEAVCGQHRTSDSETHALPVFKSKIRHKSAARAVFKALFAKKLPTASPMSARTSTSNETRQSNAELTIADMKQRKQHKFGASLGRKLKRFGTSVSHAFKQIFNR